jgi:hypothetical protein
MAALKDRYVSIGLGTLIAFVCMVAIAHAYTHSTNSVNHGLIDYYSVPVALTSPPGSQYSTAEVRHYSSDTSYNTQCDDWNYGQVVCWGTDWGTAPCQKRSVGGTDGLLARHWMRRGGCPGSLHG